MPRLTSVFIRIALLYLIAGSVLGDLLLVEKSFHVAPGLWALLPGHIEFLLIGWLVQLAMAVAFWILPRFMEGPPRGDERVAWAALLLLNAGLVSVALAAALEAPSWVMVAGRAAEFAAALLFLVHAWPRVRALPPLCKPQGG